MNTELHAAAQQYVAVMNGELVAHTGIIFFPMHKGKKRVHRLVVLPDYQGCGIGTAFINSVAAIVEQEGYELNLTTTTPALVGALRRSKEWTLARFGRAKTTYDKMAEREGYGLQYKHLQGANSNTRVTYSFWHKKGGASK